MQTVCQRCHHDNPSNANFCEQCRAPLRPPRSQQEDSVDRLARRVAEENDRMARRRLKEMYEVTPGQRKAAIIIGLVAFVIVVVIIVSALSF